MSMTLLDRGALILLTAAALFTTARAQNFNIDIETTPATGVPPTLHRGAAGQPGLWQSIDANSIVASAPLIDVNGNATSASFHFGSTSPNSIQDVSFTLAGAPPDVQALLGDGIQLRTTLLGWPPIELRFDGLLNGTYAIYYYGAGGVWAPSTGTYTFTASSWTGSYEQHTNFAMLTETAVGGTIVLTLLGDPDMTFSPVNLSGMQLVKLDASISTACAGDGSGASCPCGNIGLAGHGCANSSNATGSLLSASGTASISADTLVLQASSITNGGGLLFQSTLTGENGSGVVFADGVACLDGTLLRIATRSTAGQSFTCPAPGDLSISSRGQLGAAGGVRYYQLYFRDNGAFCTPATVNTTNALRVAWVP